MKSIQEVFHMLITAVICLMVSFVPGKNVMNIIKDGVTERQALSTETGEKERRFAQKIMEKVRCLWISSYVKRHRLWKKLFFWMQGPGDRKAAFCFTEKAAFGSS